MTTTPAVLDAPATVPAAVAGAPASEATALAILAELHELNERLARVEALGHEAHAAARPLLDQLPAALAKLRSSRFGKALGI